MPFTTIDEHRGRVERLAQALRSSTGPVRLRKHTSNLFRPRLRADRVLLDGTTLNHVISIDGVARTAEVEGMTTYADLVDATLPDGHIDHRHATGANSSRQSALSAPDDTSSDAAAMSGARIRSTS